MDIGRRKKKDIYSEMVSVVDWKSRGLMACSAENGQMVTRIASTPLDNPATEFGCKLQLYATTTCTMLVSWRSLCLKRYSAILRVDNSRYQESPKVAQGNSSLSGF